MAKSQTLLIECSNCKKDIPVHEHEAGQQRSCPYCGKPFRSPSFSVSASEVLGLIFILPMMACAKIFQLIILVPFRMLEGAVKAVKETFKTEE